jgi:nicotinamide-nucleotide amidase
LADLGWVVSRQVAIGDTGQEIEQAVREALSRADLIIVTGGLGPTSDDLTRERIAKMLEKGLHEDAAVLAHIRSFFEIRKRPMPLRTQVQAMVPDGARVLWNPNGTAPGLAMEVQPNSFRGSREGSWLILLPGPPRELRPMFTDSVVPLLREVFPAETAFVCRTFRTTGIGESSVEDKVAEPLQALVAAGLEVGYCARPGQTDVRLAARGNGAEQVVREAVAIVRAQLGKNIYGVEEEELESVIVRLLTDRKKTLALGESCTGGLLAHRITNVPGASAVLLAGCVTYSNEAKQTFLGVKAETLADHGAVSEPVAREMAEGVRERTGAYYALSVTGIAGPSGGTEAKPVGTVFIGLAGPFRTIVVRHFNPVDRETFKQMTTQQAMELLRRKLLEA